MKKNDTTINPNKILILNDLQFQEIQKIAKIGYWEANLSTGELFWSKIIFDIFGHDESTFIPTLKSFRNSIHPLDCDIVLESEKLSEKTGLHDVTHRIIRPDGDIRYVHELARRYDNGDSILRGTVQDVTEYKIAEEKISHLLIEKEQLLKEIHHRIKNSLQQIHSLLGLQMESQLLINQMRNKNLTKEEYRESLNKIINDARRRISTISLIHQMFYNENKNKISFKNFISALSKNIHETYFVTNKIINVKITGEDLDLCLDHIIPCGLIANELISNSFKHAFSDRDVGTIYIELNKTVNKNIFKISDDGCGISDISTLSGMKTLGISLIYGLAQEQLNGKVNMKTSNKGTEFEILFDIKY
jgi:two-component sensor histidine kinase